MTLNLRSYLDGSIAELDAGRLEHHRRNVNNLVRSGPGDSHDIGGCLGPKAFDSPGPGSTERLPVS